MASTTAKSLPQVGAPAPQTGPDDRTLDFSDDSSTSRSSQDSGKPLSPTTASSKPTRKPWSRRTRIFALTGLILVLVILIPAIAVPLTRHADQKAQPAEPVFINPPAPQLVANNTALRIMPLGASITYGFLSTDGNGYRNDLLGLLQRGGNTAVTYVGSRNNGTMADNAVEGWPGFRIDQVLPKARASVPQDLPNVILLNVGTNDCAQNYNLDNTTKQSTAAPQLTANATDTVGTRMRSLVDDLLAWSPNATVIMSTLILNRKTAINARVDKTNTKYRAVAADLQAAGLRVVLADMGADAGGPNATTMADSTHPNDVGYALMANRWYVALGEASDKGMIVAPTDTDGASA